MLTSRRRRPALVEGHLHAHGRIPERPLVRPHGRGPPVVLPVDRPVAHRERQTELPRERSEEHTSELQSQSNLLCPLFLSKKGCAGKAARCEGCAAAPRGRVTASSCV